MKLRKCQSVLLATSGLLLTASLPAFAGEASITGVVRDSSGMPQMDVLVQLIRTDSSILQTVRTDTRGRYAIAGILPGVYQLKAVETSFLPTLRENLRVGTRGHTEVNLTLSTLLEALQWLPAQKRTPSEPEDEWTWTLRSAAYRPLLRFVGEDGIETVESPHSASDHRRGRVLIESGAQAFGESGPSETAEYRRDSKGTAETLVRAHIGDTPASTTQLMAGYEKKNGMGSGLSTVVAFQSDPAVTAGSAQSLHEIRLRTVDSLRLTPELRAEVGNQLELIGLGGFSSTYISPFMNATWERGNATVTYALATSPLVADADGIADEASLVPLAVMHDGVLGVEHGLHQQLTLQHAGDVMSESVAIYQDNIENAIADARGLLSPAALSTGSYLFDPHADAARVSGPAYGERGVVVEVTRKGPAGTSASIRYATGSALALDNTATHTAAPVLKAQQAQSVSVRFQGASAHTGTSWRASYRLQPGSTVNAVDLFDSGAADAYLSLFLRQSLHLGRVFPGGVDAVVDVRNLLAEGYHPFLTTDGSTLFFAQVNRSVRGGLAFYF